MAHCQQKHAEAILSYKGVLMKSLSLEGLKGSFDEAEATRRFEEWMKREEAKIEARNQALKKRKKELDKRLSAEKRKSMRQELLLAKSRPILQPKRKLKNSRKKLLPMHLKQKKQSAVLRTKVQKMPIQNLKRKPRNRKYSLCQG